MTDDPELNAIAVALHEIEHRGPTSVQSPAAINHQPFRSVVDEPRVSVGSSATKRRVYHWPSLSASTDEPNKRAALGEHICVYNPDGRGALILVVEDEVDIGEFAAEILAERDFRVILAPDGEKALNIYSEIGRSINLIILDFFLPGIQGDEVFAKLKSINPKVDVLLGSGFLTKGVAGLKKLDQMLASGLRGFIPKPYTSRLLLKHVAATFVVA